MPDLTEMLAEAESRGEEADPGHQHCTCWSRLEALADRIDVVQDA